MECRVEFDYIGQEDDELNLKKGDIITHVIQKMDGWWEGQLNGKTGMFPDNFVKVVEKSTPEPPKPQTQNNNVILRSNSNKSTRRLKALFSYCPEQDDELRLDVGDIIDYIAEVEEGWWRGKLRGKVGIFPSNFVVDAADSTPNGNNKNDELKQNDLSQNKQSKALSRAVPDVVPPALPTSEPPLMDDEDNEPPPILPPKPVREQGRCFYPYQASNEDELTLVEGDIVTIISKSCDDEGWWRGELKGKTGLFPDNFVKIISPHETPNSKPNMMNSSSVQGPKISPQERTNLVGVKPINSGPVLLDRTPSNGSDKIKTSSLKKASNGTSSQDSLDGAKITKPKVEAEPNESVSSKVQRFSYMNLNPGMKPATPTSPVSSTGGSFSLPGVDSSLRNHGDEEDFNSIERSENKLNHLTAGRAKAPRRRPPSTIIGKDGEVENGINGSYNNSESFDSSSSAPINHSTPFNLSLNTSQNNSILDTSNISENGASETSASKAKKVPPWMAELKQKQDKKAHGSPNTTSSPVGTPPILPQASIEKETAPILPVKAPPLPAKPSTIPVNNSIEKNSSSPTTVSPSTALSAPIVANRSMMTGIKSKAPGYNLNHSSEGGDSSIKNLQVSYEDYAKLRDRVIILETELETIRRQVKLLLDTNLREMGQGHIV